MWYNEGAGIPRSLAETSSGFGLSSNGPLSQPGGVSLFSGEQSGRLSASGRSRNPCRMLKDGETVQDTGGGVITVKYHDGIGGTDPPVFIHGGIEH